MYLVYDFLKQNILLQKKTYKLKWQKKKELKKKREKSMLHCCGEDWR